MADWTVADVARMSGVSVRALHHYDRIGLLKPARTGANGYRYYGRAELLRLQQILIHRELDIPLARIGAILDEPGFDRLDALRRQRSGLAGKAERYAELVTTIDRTIADLKGERAMRETDLYKGFSAEKQAEYEAWLVERYGAAMEDDIARSKAALAAQGEAGQQAMMAELAELEQGLAEGLRRGAPPDSEALSPLLERHSAWVAAMWGKPCPPAAYAGLADLYLSHPDFVARYETIEPGFADYLAAAMKAWAAQCEEAEIRDGTV